MDHDDPESLVVHHGLEEGLLRALHAIIGTPDGLDESDVDADVASADLS